MSDDPNEGFRNRAIDAARTLVRSTASDDRAGLVEQRIKESMEVCRHEDLHDLEAAFAEAAATITTLTAERDEAIDRVEELERDAEIVSVEFEKDCWAAVRSLLERVGHKDFSEGVTASDACDIIWEAIEQRDAQLSEANRLLALVRAISEKEHDDDEWGSGAKAVQEDIRETLAIRVGEGREDSPSSSKTAAAPQEVCPASAEEPGK
jgi:hypothetical protein